MSPPENETPDPKGRLAELRAALEECPRVLILAHDNPDPDALASAFAMKAVLEHDSEIACTVGYGGIIGRAENRAMTRELELDPMRIEERDWDDFEGIVLVDTQPGFGNNSLPAERTATAVIDHHPIRGSLVNVAFVDVREGYGATASMAHEYVQASGVSLPANLLTALFYAIKSETQELGRDAGYADRDAYLNLLPRADKAIIARIQRARVPRDYFRAFQIAIANARVHGRTVLTDLEEVDTPDIVAEIADFLLRLEGADWAVCLGRHGDAMVLSVRTSDPDAHAGQLIRRVVAGLGRAGGHGMMAGGRIPLGKRDYDDVAGDVRDRLLEALGDGGEGDELVAD